MRNRIGKFVACCTLLLLVAPVAAEEWIVIGTRQLGMGGAGVATTRGGLSTYWNPAALAAPDGASGIFGGWDVEAQFGVSGGAVGNVIDKLDTVFDTVDSLDFNALEPTLDDPAALLNDEQLQSILRLVTEELPALNEPGTGLIVDGSLGVAGRFGYFGMAATGLSYGGGLTTVDLSTLALGDEGLTGVLAGGQDRSGSLSPEGQTLADLFAAQGLASQNQAEELVFQAEQAGVSSSNPNSQANLESLLQSTADNIGGGLDEFLTQNASGVNLRGIVLQEYAVGFAYPFFDMVSVGVSGKLLYGQTYFKPFTLGNLENPSDLVNELFDSFTDTEDSLNFGVDVGVLFQPVDFLSFGVVGRNLNRPSFEFAGPGDYVLEPQVRAGVGANLPLGFTLAADLDLMRNESEALTGYQSQMLGGGVEWQLFGTLILRGGLSQNIADLDQSPVVHAGLAAHFLGISLEASGKISTRFQEIGGNEVPERAGAAFLVGINIPLD